MNDQEKQLILNRLLSEYHYYRIETNGKWSKFCSDLCKQHYKFVVSKPRIFEFFVRTPSPQILYQANIVYDQAIDHLRFSEHYNSESIIEFMKKHIVNCEESRKAEENIFDDLDPVYYWTDDMETKLKEHSEKIDAFKIKLYNNSDAPKKQIDEIRVELRRFQKLYNELYTRKHSFDYLTAEDVAARLFSRYLYGNTLYNVNKQPIRNLPHTLLDSIAAVVRNESIPGTHLREMARTSPWLSYYKTAQPNPFINVPLSNDILQLMSLTRWYEWVRELPIAQKEGEIGRPSDKVMDDDDMLDGWYLLYEKQKPTHDKVLIESNKFNVETFVMAKTPEEANEVWKRNNKMAQTILKTRAEQIRGKQSGLGVKNQDLKDVKLDIGINYNKQVAAMQGARK